VVDQSLDAGVGLADFFEYLDFLSDVDFTGHCVSSGVYVWLIFFEEEYVTLDICEFYIFLTLGLQINRDESK